MAKQIKHKRYLSSPRYRRKRIIIVGNRKKIIKKYQPIVNKAKKKGYKVPNINRKTLAVDEVDIPESYWTDGFILPEKVGKTRKDMILIDDDAKKDYQERAFAHELGHLHMFKTGIDDEDKFEANDIKIENKADKIGAHILDMDLKKFNSPDVTYMDTVYKGRRKRKC